MSFNSSVNLKSAPLFGVITNFLQTRQINLKREVTRQAIE